MKNCVHWSVECRRTLLRVFFVYLKMDDRRRIVITAAVAGYLPIKKVTHEENSDEEY